MGVDRKPMPWLLAALGLWVGAGVVDRRTQVEVSSNGGRVQLEVAGTTLSAPVSVRRLSAVEISAMDSVDPPGGRSITVSSDGVELLSDRLPRRFRFPAGHIVPLGDWELDEGASHGTVWRHSFETGGTFTVRAGFRGRFHHDLTLALDGDPPFSCAVRRGLINNDCFVRDAAGFTLATTSIDPTPVADIGAAFATFARAVAISCLLIGIFSALRAASRSSPIPSASRSWRVTPWISLIAMMAVAVSGWVAHDVLEGLPHSPDSVVYLLQAGWLLDGSLWGEAAEFQNTRTIPFTYIDGERWLAHYPPGWPGLLALGRAVGLPWLVAPLLGGLYVVLLYLTGRELEGPALGLGAAVLALISPMARLIFGSMLSHAAAATLLLAAFWLVLVARRSMGWPAAALSGVAVGLAFGIRPLSAVAIAVPLGAVLVLDLRGSSGGSAARARFLGFSAGSLAAAAPALLANHLITGHALAFPYTLVGDSMYLQDNIPFGIRNLDALLVHTGTSLFGWGWSWVHGPGVIALAFAFICLPFVLRRTRSTDLLMAAMIACILVAHLGTRGHGLHGFGPRYYFDAFALFFLLTARGFAELARMGRGVDLTEKKAPALAAVILFLALNFSAAAVLPRRLGLYRAYNGVDASLQQQVEEARLDRALIVLPVADWRGWAMAARLMEPGADAELLFIQTRPDDPAIPEIAGDRPVFVWRDGGPTAESGGGLTDWEPAMATAAATVDSGSDQRQ